MANAIRVYSGNDSFGRSVEMAERADGVWYVRAQNSRGAMSRWARCESPTWETSVVNAYDGTVTTFEPGEVIRYGFKKLTPSDPKGLRLPGV